MWTSTSLTLFPFPLSFIGQRATERIIHTFSYIYSIKEEEELSELSRNRLVTTIGLKMLPTLKRKHKKKKKVLPTVQIQTVESVQLIISPTRNNDNKAEFTTFLLFSFLLLFSTAFSSFLTMEYMGL